ncbi:hypothetical protein QP992_11315 [Corynebacterium ulcerans]|uniref:hypothetical protein n=1 Tax=Corynebacterium ulcerans TaxID=65058 RepID=UPI0018D6F9AF|nr:hypothetical protein [Corynebacterium ulcerans]MBH5296956.1 hypothetical protein [Corynebacterium ulcerans]MDK8889735.1 hypothetical protein [Corynebacterium ulcerans]
MPRVKGKLSTITERPSLIREVWIRPNSTRPGVEGLIVDEPVRVLVDDSGEFTVDLALGAGVLILIGPGGIGRESIPLLIHEGTATIRQAVEDAKDFTPEVADKLAELAAETQKNLEEAREVKAEADSATGRMREAAQALKDSVAGAIAEATAGIKKSGSELLASMQVLQSKAASSESEAKESAQGAEASRSAALASESAASASAGEAAESLAGLRAKIEEWKPNAEQLEKWQPQYQWLKENAASGFSKITEMMQDAAAGVRGELAGLVEQARTAQTTAGQHALKAQAAANNAESVTNRVVDAAINKLLGGASSAYDTLKELEDKLTDQDSVAAAIMRQLAEKASHTDVSALAQKITNLGIDGVRGLSAALASKANTIHTHATSEIVGLAGELNALKSSLGQKADAQDMDAKVDRDDVVGIVEKSRKIEEAWDYARRAMAGMPDMRIVDAVPEYPSPNVWYFVKEPS